VSGQTPSAARLAVRESLKRALQRRNRSGVQTSGSMAVEAIVLVFGGK